MSTFVKLAASALISALLLMGGIFTGEKLNTPTQTTQTFGAAFTPVGGQTYTLQGAGVTATQNTILLASFTTPDGRPITTAMIGSIGYGVIEPNTTSKIEDVTFTGVTQNANGSAVLTGVTRGNDFVSPYLASSTLAKAHAGGSYFILSNTAGFYGQQFLFANTLGTSTGGLIFSSTTPPKYDADPIWLNFTPQILADVSYVNSVVAAGAANASTLVKGIIQIATATQTAAGTATGSTGALLVPPNSLYNATQSATTIIPVTNTNGKLSQAFLDLTQAFTTTGQWTFNTVAPLFNVGLVSQASSTFVGNTNLNQPGQVFNSATTTTSFPLPMVIATSTGKVSTGSSLLASSTIGFIGFSLSNATNGSTLFVQTSGVVSGFTGLTTGKDYYIQDAGGIGVTPGTIEAYVGTSISTTQLAIEQPHDMQFMGSVPLQANGVATTSAGARIAIAEVNAGGTGGGGGIYMTLVGHSSGSFTWFASNSGGGSAGSYGTSCSFSTTIVTCSNSGSLSSGTPSGTVYFYR